MATIKLYPICPRCNSIKTGKIKPNSSFSSRDYLKNIKRLYAHSLYEKTVDINKYRSYYYPMKIEWFCADCDYEFCGEISIIECSEEEKEEYESSRKYNIPIEYKKKNSKLNAFINKFIKKIPHYNTDLKKG